MRCTIINQVIYLWLTTLFISSPVLFYTARYGIHLLLPPELFWAVIAPPIVGLVYKARYGKRLPWDTAKRTGIYFATSIVLAEVLLALDAKLNPSTFQQPHNWLYVIYGLVFECAIALLVGRWLVAIGLCLYRK